MIIYLDMDGVCCDFIGGVSKLFKYESLYDTWPIGVWDVSQRMGISKAKFRQKIEQAGVGFWNDLEEYPHFKELHKMLCSYGRVIFLTDPGMWASAPSGKRLWLRERFGYEHKDWVITPIKDIVHKSNTILIDDNPDNCTMFPNSILFPQPWNSNLWQRMDRVEYIKEEVVRLLNDVNKECY